MTFASGTDLSPELVNGSIRINPLGYLPPRGKRAFVTVACREFSVLDSNWKPVHTGVATGPVKDADTGHDLWTLDFTDLETEGEYVIDVVGVGRSTSFKIADDIYNFPFYLTTRAMYLWRCGIDVSATHNGNEYRQNACHLDDGHFLDGGRRVDATGGWHDAGDYNKYIVNAGVTVGSMLLAWDMFTDRLRGIRLDIPESGGPLPDFLAEVKWEIDWLLKMQAEDGRIYHKLSAINFCGFIMPDEEKDPRYFSPWSSAATADFAAMCAMSARIFAPFDAAYAERCLTSAVRAYDFLLTHPENHAGDLSAFTTGGYTTDDRDDRLWMAAELWDATGDGRYRVDFEQRLHGAEVTVDVDWDWGNVANLGLIRYLLSKRAKDQALTDAIADAVVKAGEAIVDARLANGYARPMGSRYYWGSNGTVARQAIVLSLANRLVRQGTESRYGGCDFVESGLDALAYLFGRNPYNRSFVTGLGQNPPLYPHDRRSGADGIVDPWPGYLVGGGWPGALDWKDEERSHETNEIAINWNSALIFALAWFVAA